MTTSIRMASFAVAILLSISYNIQLSESVFLFVKKANVTECLDDVDNGQCPNATFEGSIRYYYNRKYGVCMAFKWFGCSKNGNNFDTFERCAQNCDHDESRFRYVNETTVCNKGDSPYYYNNYAGLSGLHLGIECGKMPCPYRTYCRYYDTEVATCCQPNQQSCHEPAESGSCNVIVPTSTRYYYDKAAKRCLPFKFSGCGGNANNYRSYESCAKRCYKDSKGSSIDSEKGMCPNGTQPFLPIDSFPKAIGRRCDDVECPTGFKCTQSTTFLAQCCGVPDFYQMCTGGIDRGLQPCQASLRQQRWRYDMATAKCYPIKYTGCGSVWNSFTSIDICLECSGRTDFPDDDQCHGRFLPTRKGGACPPGHVYRQEPNDVATCCNSEDEEAYMLKEFDQCDDGSLAWTMSSELLSRNITVYSEEGCDDLVCPVGYGCRRTFGVYKCCHSALKST